MCIEGYEIMMMHDQRRQVNRMRNQLKVSTLIQSGVCVCVCGVLLVTSKIRQTWSFLYCVVCCTYVCWADYVVTIGCAV